MYQWRSVQSSKDQENIHIASDGARECNAEHGYRNIWESKMCASDYGHSGTSRVGPPPGRKCEDGGVAGVTDHSVRSLLQYLVISG